MIVKSNFCKIALVKYLITFVAYKQDINLIKT